MHRLLLLFSIIPSFTLSCMQTVEPGTTIAPPVTTPASVTTSAPGSTKPTTANTTPNTSSTSTVSTTTTTACSTCTEKDILLLLDTDPGIKPIQPTVVQNCNTLTVTCVTTFGSIVIMNFNDNKFGNPGSNNEQTEVGTLQCSPDGWQLTDAGTTTTIKKVFCATT